MTTTDSGTTLQGKAVELYQDDFTMEPNADGHYTLVIKKVKLRSDDIFPTIFFFVWNNNDNTMIYQDRLPQGKVSWTGPFEITCESITGVVGEGRGGKKYVYNVQSGISGDN
ncbi:MAG: hypothetical protein HKN76_06195 [Saprospiraceae bacterium]|nr:hypothetical protein [Saprospiraceae bacterium]